MPNMKPVKTFYLAYIIYDNKMSLCSIWLSFLCCRELFTPNASYEDSGDSLIYNGIHILLFMMAVIFYAAEIFDFVLLDGCHFADV